MASGVGGKAPMGELEGCWGSVRPTIVSGQGAIETLPDGMPPLASCIRVGCKPRKSSYSTIIELGPKSHTIWDSTRISVMLLDPLGSTSDPMEVAKGHVPFQVQ